MNRTEADSIRDLIDITFKDMYRIYVNPKDETIDINCYFLTEPKEIKLSLAGLMLCKNSAKGFINYLKEKITEGLKEKSDE